MSNLALSSGDDYPAAARKHLNDAKVLLDAKRFDAAGYLAGYIVECSLRSVVMVGRLATEAETTATQEKRTSRKPNLKMELQPSGATLQRFKRMAGQEARDIGQKHELDRLATATSGYTAVLTSHVAQYAPSVAAKPLGGAWTEGIRYRAEGAVTESQARTWVREAEEVYKSTIGQMMRDGLITS
ncbi:hypothetical protein [Polyangium sp. y55x31]|uniref:hypothetical protein n=1 Tax=Polyangium sp. y55x31 TaxID=3042688 RepID=UPI0024829B25|nr:hypothetical protein [Polyangium sp. y55x31]MDI1482639.1 hypothetical protein [Polyangium sp. y55x31]